MNRRYTTLDDAISTEITPALGEFAGQFDVEAIARETFRYRVDTSEAGVELLNAAGFEQVVDTEQFWAIAAKHDRGRS